MIKDNCKKETVIIIGAGLAGLSAAISLAKKNIKSSLISQQPSERAQSNMAEGGINGALDTMGENDSCKEHFNDTMKAGAFLADPNAVKRFADAAPSILKELQGINVPFNQKDGKLLLRNFGGQKKKRTAFAKSSTGKVLMSALIDEARKYEAQGLLDRYSHHEFLGLILSAEKRCIGARVLDSYSQEVSAFYGPVIMACGGLNGLLPGHTTGSVANTADAAAILMCQGVTFSNLEMIQYHPTTIGIPRKRCLISEAARGEGGRLFTEVNGKTWYFMEEKYPELKNLMPRDVVAREMFLLGKEQPVFLDMRHLDKRTWKEKLPDLREEIIHYLGKDPAKEPILVEPGIHYFMGGIDVDVDHRCNIPYLYAAGECCSQYHGANRLGGNSTMGAIFGGKVAADTLAKELQSFKEKTRSEQERCSGTWEQIKEIDGSAKHETADFHRTWHGNVACGFSIEKRIGELLYESLGIVRNEAALNEGLSGLDALEAEVNVMLAEQNAACEDTDCGEISKIEPKRPMLEGRFLLARAMLLSARERRESRGAHFREDYPKPDEQFRGQILMNRKENEAQLSMSFRKL